MAKKKKVKKEKTDESGTIGHYFIKPKTNIQFVKTGSARLDCSLGGGYAIGRIVNLIGDRSTGKTLLCIEACANFAKQYPNGKIKYIEAEAAFDEPYAAALGMPLDRVDFAKEKDGSHVQTVEQFYKHTVEFCKSLGKDEVGLVVLDSLDSLSDDAEMKRELGDATYGTGKAKSMSEIFRRVTSKLEEKNVLMVIVSQVRENINAGMFGRKYTRSGGKSLDFYASQVCMLSQMGTESLTKKKVKRTVGVNIRVRVEKNKVGMAYRECDFTILFGFGIDDVTSNCKWLAEVRHNDLLGMSLDALKPGNLRKFINGLDDKEYRAFRIKTIKAVKKAWYEIEKGFLPNRKKY
jgi:recombination protein RecA|tara:strand:- start:60351 stop:61397 length:1047 start_codon:yes stop_codon:yes gene_type:complete